MKSLVALNALAVKEPMSLTQKVCRLLAEKGLSAADVELRAAGKISYSLIAAIAAGDCENLRFDTLKALAKGLGVAHERLFAAAIGLEMPEYCEADFAVLDNKCRDVADDDRAELEGLLALLHREIERLLREQKASTGRPQQLTIVPHNRVALALQKHESLRDFVGRILKEKRLTLRDVEQRSKKKISAAYLSDMLHERARNLTIEKIQALALGLGVTALDIFMILEGQSTAERQSFRRSRFAALYHKYQNLSLAGKKELRLLVRLIDQEIDYRQMQTLRLAATVKPRQQGTA